MNRQNLSQKMVWAILIMLLLVGCGAPADTPTLIPPTDILTPTSESLPETDAMIEVTFDGNECTVSGPSELLTGRNSFVLNDLSDKDVDLWVGRLLEGKTVQDLFDKQGEPGVWWPKEDWFFYTTEMGPSWVNENGGEVWTYLLNEEGEHVIYVGIYLPDTKHLWFCPQTMDVEATSE